MQNAKRHNPGRRTLLRGAGVALALPWLESRSAWPAAAEPLGRSGKPPRRLAVLFIGNGINEKHWWAKGTGAAMELGKSLEPMLPLRGKLNFVTGLFNQATMNVGIHPPQTGNLLSGASLQKGAEIKAAITMDQLLANSVGQDSALPSLVLGCEQPTTGFHETNYSLTYSSHISWASDTSPVPIEQYPALAFDSLTENRGNQRMKSVLDRVMEQAQALSGSVSREDKIKLDEYLTSVRELEVRIARSQAAQANTPRSEAADTKAKMSKAKMSKAKMSRPAEGLPEDINLHMRLMCDLIALAFQTDRTRIATLLLCRDLSGLTYPFLGVRVAHHLASHNDLSDDYEKIVRFHVGHYAYLASRLDAMQEADGTVLDNSCLMFTSNMWSGNRHNSSRLPLLLTGGLGRTIKTGRVIDYTQRGDANRKMCSLYLRLMESMGLPLSSFGDADTRLPEFA